MGRKRIPKTRSMLEVLCAAPGSGLGIMQTQESFVDVSGPLKRITPAAPAIMKRRARARNSESN